MNKISCFLPYAGKEQVEKTVNSLQATGLRRNPVNHDRCHSGIAPGLRNIVC